MRSCIPVSWAVAHRVYPEYPPLTDKAGRPRTVVSELNTAAKYRALSMFTVTTSVPCVAPVPLQVAGGDGGGGAPDQPQPHAGGLLPADAAAHVAPAHLGPLRGQQLHPAAGHGPGAQPVGPGHVQGGCCAICQRRRVAAQCCGSLLTGLMRAAAAVVIVSNMSGKRSRQVSMHAAKCQ